MPRIPTYDSPQVEARALPGVHEESVATPELLGSAGNAALAIGGGAAAAGSGLAAVVYHMQQKENLRKVQDAATEYGSRVLDYQTEAQKNRTGSAAQGLVTDFSDWHKKQIDDIAKSLGNDAQREAFVAMARKNGLAARHDIATFETQQTRAANIASYDAQVTNNINLGAVALTPEAADAFKQQVIANTKAFGAINNFQPGDGREEALLAKQLTEFHAQRIQNLARTDPASAVAYFEANKNEIAGAKQAEIGKFAQQATSEITGVNTAGDIWATVGPAKGLDAMEEAAREKFKNDPFTLRATITNLRERQQAYDKGQQERVDTVASSVNLAILNGSTPSQIRRMPEFIALSQMGSTGGKMANAIIEHAENKQYSATLRATAAEARQQQVLARRGMGAYLDYSNPDKLDKMSEAQIINLLPTLGNELTNHLIQQKRALVKTEGKIVEARMDQQDFEHIANEVGLKPFDPHKNEDERASLGELKFAIEQKIDAAQQAKKGPLTRQEKMQLMRQEFDNKVLIDEWGRDPTKPMILLKPDELKNAYVVVGDKEVKLSSIPAADRAAIITSRRKHGLPVTEQAIAEMWVQRNAAGSGRENLIPR